MACKVDRLKARLLEFHILLELKRGWGLLFFCQDNRLSDLRCWTPLLLSKQGSSILLFLPSPPLQTRPGAPGWNSTGGFVKEKTAEDEAAAAHQDRL